MAERVSGPYRGYYISAAARLVPAAGAQGTDSTDGTNGTGGTYVGSVSLAELGPDDAHRMETLLDLGDQQRFGSEEEALAYVEQAARDYVDRLLGGKS
ncbi:hypothetical protein LMG28727_01053 [Paraburkholderia kirstenboschensis]|uniref:hypothetical protein n=1 Tax=Paraburkholderia kirstenboschensis TaxID=1245436 RepID=UPI000ABB57CA|nr:hypothetical protein [Paraburkholderia kirstenboschensis]CAD6514968.1 hypothetical protein LMG28727_01053 [Paraburkholderia kirstenboschensis]